ncbi:MAG: MarR family winged helix-turn-helix transcriptional regulator [Rhodobacter sp.]|nr:MarR family winged helix-turn-helix transcriptional regulator [Rhodobacter sp.]
MPGFQLDAFLPYQLSVLSARVSRGFAELYRAQFGISVTEWRVLAHLSQSEAVSVREITDRVDLEKSKVSRAAKRLQAEGYVSKRPHETDGRLVALSLTEKGRSLVEAVAPIAHTYQADVLDVLGGDAPDFQAALTTLLRATGGNSRP